MVCTQKIQMSYWSEGDRKKVMVIDFNYEISSVHKRFYLPFNRKSTKAELDLIVGSGREAVIGLMGIEGITMISISTYRITIHKAPLYEWLQMWENIKDFVVNTVPEGCRGEYELYEYKDGKNVSIFQPTLQVSEVK